MFRSARTVHSISVSVTKNPTERGKRHIKGELASIGDFHDRLFSVSFVFKGGVVGAREDVEDLSAHAGGVTGLGRPSSPSLKESSFILFWSNVAIRLGSRNYTPFRRNNEATGRKGTADVTRHKVKREGKKDPFMKKETQISTDQVATPRDPEFPHKLGFQTQLRQRNEEPLNFFCRGTEDFAQIPNSVMPKRQWRRSAPSDDRKKKNRVEPRKPTLMTADKRKNREPAGKKKTRVGKVKGIYRVGV
ncbi:hypothetical protein GEV33_006886 [Tenebrio molitor]|uniref:Uncharacterized protein n=1 Tax=Tenebrio molitor TaxID=7067 RepID=A0A8J6HBS6_TENMO|nr:hypothetical protein GEV33_006886 [Tenebrio molitor]